MRVNHRRAQTGRRSGTPAHARSSPRECQAGTCANRTAGRGEEGGGAGGGRTGGGGRKKQKYCQGESDWYVKPGRTRRQTPPPDDLATPPTPSLITFRRTPPPPSLSFPDGAGRLHLPPPAAVLCRPRSRRSAKCSATSGGRGGGRGDAAVLQGAAPSSPGRPPPVEPRPARRRESVRARAGRSPNISQGTASRSPRRPLHVHPPRRGGPNNGAGGAAASGRGARAPHPCGRRACGP